jgi:HK97 family phage portal protein
MKFSTFFSNAPAEERSMSFQDIWGMGYDQTGLPTKAGTVVSYDTAMTVSAVYGSIRILSDNIATLPIDAYQHIDDVRVKYRPRPEWLDFRLGPFGKIEVISQMLVSLLLDGNAYVATYRDATGTIVWMEVLDPKQVVPQRVGSEVRYSVNGQPSVSSMDILHITGMTMPGDLSGISPVTAARESIGLSIASTEYGAAFFGNGAVPGTVVEVPGQLSEQGIKQLKNAWNEKHQGVGNSHKLAVVTEGAKFSKITVDPDDAQFLQTREFQISDIARIYGVPPHLLADASGSTSWGSGLAEQNTMFVQQSLRPWVERIEEGLTTAMLMEGRPSNTFIKLNVDGLLRGDHKQRMDSYAIGLSNGIYTIDEVRAYEDLPPLPTEVEDSPEETDPVDGSHDAVESARQVAEIIQKIYLGVGIVVSTDEARALANQAGADLVGELPAQSIPDMSVPEEPDTLEPQGGGIS